MSTVRMGLVLAENYASVAFADKTTVTKHCAISSTGNRAHDINAALSQVEKEIHQLGKRITSVTIVSNATRTALHNAKDLNKVALIRLSSPEGRDSPPLLNSSIADKVLAGFFVVKGGHGFDGRLIGAPDAAEIKSCYDKVKRSADAFVVTSPFSILYPDHEEYAVTVLAGLGVERIWASTQVSSETSMLDRETTSILTASTSKVLEKEETEVLSSLKKLGCRPAIYFGRNDGTVFGSALAKRFPLDTAWGVEGHSAAGASKTERLSECLVAGVNGEETWVTGARKGRPIMRRITYIDDMLLHVASPVIADFSSSTPSEMKKLRYKLISQFSGATKVLAADLKGPHHLPFKVINRTKSPAYAAINAATATIEWAWTKNIPKETDLKITEKNLRSMLQSYMKQGGAKSYKFGTLESRPGINLPDGTRTLSLQARGLPV